MNFKIMNFQILKRHLGNKKRLSKKISSKKINEFYLKAALTELKWEDFRSGGGLFFL